MAKAYVFYIGLFAIITTLISTLAKPYYDDSDEIDPSSSNYYFEFPEVYIAPERMRRDVNESVTPEDDSVAQEGSLRASPTTKSPILQAIQNGTDFFNKTWNSLMKDPTKFFETLMQNGKLSAGESPKLILRGSSTYIAPLPNLMDGLQMFMNFMKLMRPQT